MGKYCDSKELESVWQSWIIASKFPQLERARETGKLWSRRNNNWISFCVATLSPYRFNIELNKTISSKTSKQAIRSSFFPTDITLLHQLENRNYRPEIIITESWDRLTSMIYDICSGIALNFRPANSDIKNDLIHEAFTCILNKIHNGNLEFTPGRAPAFNLLTTAIFRVMYSIKTKEKRQRNHQTELLKKINNGDILPSYLIKHDNIKTQK